MAKIIERKGFEHPARRLHIMVTKATINGVTRYEKDKNILYKAAALYRERRPKVR